MSFLFNFVFGLIFGLGLVISGMSDPAKVLNFLDVFGTWDPSLAFVMASAVLVTFIGYQLVFAQGEPVADMHFQLPRNNTPDTKAVTGPAIFGIGWGLGGFCPGPALTAAGLGAAGTLVFLPMMFLGMWAARGIGTPGGMTALRGWFGAGRAQRDA